MVKSMTGFASAARELAEAALNIDLRSVNHRYLEIQFRLPDELRNLEQAMREQIVENIARGKVECRVSVQQKSASATRIDASLLARLTELNREIKSTLPGSAGLSVADVLRWPGILVSEATSDIEQSCLDLLRDTLREFVATRAREGEKLKNFLLQKITAMKALVESIAPRIPQFLAAHQEKLAARLRNR